jgi:hypothetical protein
MLPSYLLSLREGIEAALIVGIVLSALRQMRRTDLSMSVWAGVIGAILISILVAVVLTIFGLSLEGPAEPVFEGVTVFLAAAVLTWMIFWMNSHSRHIKGELEAGVRRAAFETGKRGLFLLAFGLFGCGTRRHRTSLVPDRGGLCLQRSADHRWRAAGPVHGNPARLVDVCDGGPPGSAPVLPSHRYTADPVCCRVGSQRGT